MGESPQSSPADTRNKSATPPCLPHISEEPGMDLGALFISFLLWQRLGAKSDRSAQGLDRARGSLEPKCFSISCCRGRKFPPSTRGLLHD